MIDRENQVLIIGGGPAGLAAALGARRKGVGSVIFDKDRRLGGILRQCIHDGFGLEIFDEALTGPEYASRYREKVRDDGKIDFWPESTVLDISSGGNVIVSRRDGIDEVNGGATVLAMGCRERTRGELGIPGPRPSGIYTAGTAQRLINLKNTMVGKEAVVLGSGDVGLIIARRLTLEGADVKGVVEILPYSSGLPRNVQQCLKDFDIPLRFNRTVTEVYGDGRLEGVIVSQVDDKGNPISGTEKRIECDTLLISAGLIPKNDLFEDIGVETSEKTGGPTVNGNLETSRRGVFACGNVLHVHDLVDYATQESLKAGEMAGEFVKSGFERETSVRTIAGEGIQYVLPQEIHPGESNELSFRVETPSRKSSVKILSDGKLLKEERFKGLHPAQMIKMELEDNLSVSGGIRVEVSK